MPRRVPDDTGYPPLIYERQFVPPPEMVSDPKP
jgi:arylsulfatase